MAKKLNLGQTIETGWNLTIKNFPYLLGIMATMFVVNILLSVGNDLLVKNKVFFLGILVWNIITWIVGVLINLGLIRIALDLLAGKKDRFTTLFLIYRPILKTIGAGILVSLITALPILIIVALWLANMFFGKSLGNETLTQILNIALGFLGIITVGFAIYAGVRLMFYSYFIVDKDSKAIESLKLSFAATKGEFWMLFLLQIALVGINFVGALALLVGLLLTIPLSIIAMAAAYRQISSTFSPEPIIAQEAAAATVEPVAAQ